MIWSGLYTVHGGFIDWTNDGLGMLSFSNELWNGGQYFNSPDLQTQQRDPNSPINNRVAQYFFDDMLEFGDQFVEWKAFEHPQFGKVEMGGWKKTQGRVPPRFMNEELCHRNMAFSLYQADEMPQMKSGETKVEAIGGGVYRVRVDFTNPKAHADDPRQGGPEQRRPARSADGRGRRDRGPLGRMGGEQVPARSDRAHRSAAIRSGSSSATATPGARRARSNTWSAAPAR